MRIAARLSLLALFGATACRSQGCAKERETHQTSAALSPKTIDCSPGLAKCEGGSVSVSANGTIVENCTTPETCVCPWVVVGACNHACVADDVTVIAAEAVALVQLCEAHAAVLPSASKAEAPCKGPGWICDAGNLFRCGDDEPTASVEAACEHGCAKVSGVDEMLPLTIASKLLCAR